MPRFWKGTENRWTRILAIGAIVVATIINWAGVEDKLCAGYNFLQQVATFAWSQLSFAALLGIVLLIIGPLLFIGYVLPLILGLFRQQPIYRHVPVALDEATCSVRVHMENAINVARPQGRVRRDLGLWERLVSAAVAGQTHPDVLKGHCEQGNKDRPVIFCNFRGYAHGVRAVLNDLPTLGLTHPFPRVWTLLKRSVFEWYNPFPLVADATGAPGRVTLKWWEDYKSHIKILKTDGTIRIHRLTAHPPLHKTLGEIEDYCMYSESALNLPEALVAAGRCPNVSWLPSVQAALALSRKAARETRIHLIGKPNGGAGNGIRVLTLFESSYHSGAGSDDGDEAGVFLRYLPNKQGHESLLKYDDLFIVELSDSLVFGLAFIDDESLDINGMRILPPHQLSRALTGDRRGEALLLSFGDAWAEGKDSFHVCKGLDRCL